MTENDFIIIGSGSAGSVLAARLSENPDVRVLLLEAGCAEVPAASSNPAIWTTALGTDVDWNYQTTEQAGLQRRVVAEPHGKMLGGSSSLNGMLYVRGHRDDFAAWERQGARGWGFADCLPYFQRLEHFADDADGQLGHNGRFHIEDVRRHHPHPAAADFVASCQACGHSLSKNWNGAATDAMLGAGWFSVNVKEQRRFSASDAYLSPARSRPNLRVETEAQATQLLWQGARCTGVEYVQHNRKQTATAAREVLLCAGAAESPKLLMLSGVGNPQQLSRFEILVRLPLAGVGANLHDHAMIPVAHALRHPAPQAKLLAFEAGLFFAPLPGTTRPQLQLIFGTTTFDTAAGQAPRGFTIVSALVRPHSRGSVRLQSRDPFVAPLLDPNFLADERDSVLLAQAVRTAREVFAAAPLATWVGAELSPASAPSSGEDWERLVRAHTISQWHIVGSCRMGTDEMAVVDAELRVRGAEGLRVVDSSVMPEVISGNSQAAVLMIAERAADFIRQTHGL